MGVFTINQEIVREWSGNFDVCIGSTLVRIGLSMRLRETGNKR